MPSYYVHLSANHLERLPPVDELPSVRAAGPLEAAEAVLRDGRFAQVPGLRWARVVTAVHANGIAKRVMRFPIMAENGPRID
jgi:hypothetical protein